MISGVSFSAANDDDCAILQAAAAAVINSFNVANFNVMVSTFPGLAPGDSFAHRWTHNVITFGHGKLDAKDTRILNKRLPFAQGSGRWQVLGNLGGGGLGRGRMKTDVLEGIGD